MPTPIWAMPPGPATARGRVTHQHPIRAGSTLGAEPTAVLVTLQHIQSHASGPATGIDVLRSALAVGRNTCQFAVTGRKVDDFLSGLQGFNVLPTPLLLGPGQFHIANGPLCRPHSLETGRYPERVQYHAGGFTFACSDGAFAFNQFPVVGQINIPQLAIFIGLEFTPKDAFPENI